MESTLVLDQRFVAVGRVPWRRAVVWLFEGTVEVLESYEDREVRSVSFAIKMPSVVRFVRKLVRRRPSTKFSRENVYARDKGRCQYCGDRVERCDGTYDHVVPRAQGGATEWTNVVIACVPCNQRKGGRTPAQAGMRLLSAPVKPKVLPEGLYRLTWSKAMPLSWRSWLYWNAELESGE